MSKPWLIILAIVSLLVFGAIGYYLGTQNKNGGPPGLGIGQGRVTACTLEAKICPDGTSVGRVPPDCEFAPCPASDQVTPEPTPANSFDSSAPGGSEE